MVPKLRSAGRNAAAILFCLLAATVARAQDTVPLAEHVPHWATAERDLRPASPDLPLDHLRLTLARPAEREAAFQQLLIDQQNPHSLRYHHWLTPEQIGEEFGPAQADIDQLRNWLQQQGLTVDAVANSRGFLVFHGTVRQVEQAFQTSIHVYAANTGERMSVAEDPRIPPAFAHIVQSIQGLSQHEARPAAHAQPAYSACYTSPCLHFVTPADFAAIYNVPSASYKGTGQTIALVGRAQVYSPDITEYEANTALPDELPILIVPPSGVTPPAPNDSTTQPQNDDQTEATIDVQRAIGTAPGATVDLVASLSTQTADGIDIAKDYVIDDFSTVKASILNISFGSCELDQTASFIQSDNSLFEQAAAEGISVLVASGDSGASGCDSYNSTPPTGAQPLSPNYLCSSSYVTCLGGTEFNDSGSTAYWNTANGTGLESATGYIPEGAWNEPYNSSSGDYFTSATGGGVSSVIATPYWQTGTGVPGTAGRYTPDIAFSSSAHDGYYGCYAANGGNCADSYFEYFYGTSAAAPSMAGVVALLNQKLGDTQGNLNPTLYSLATNPANTVFHDATIATSGVTNCSAAVPSLCNNSTPSPTSLTGGQPGYLLQTGFDLATGWGSVNVGNLLSHWATGGPAATTTSLAIGPSATVAVGTTITLTAHVTSTTTAAGAVAFYYESLLLATVSLSGGSASLSIPTAGLPPGTYPLHAVFEGCAGFVPSTSVATTVTLTSATSSTTLAFSANPANPGPVTLTATVTSSAGMPTGTVTFNYQPSNGTLALGTVSLVNGKASLSVNTTGLPAAQYPIQAVYSGSSTIAASRSAITDLTLK